MQPSVALRQSIIPAARALAKRTGTKTTIEALTDFHGRLRNPALMEELREEGRELDAVAGIAKLLVDAVAKDPELGNDSFDDGVMKWASGISLSPLARREALSKFAQSMTFGRYLREGSKTYEVSPGLTQRLLSTEVRGVPGEFLKLPFPAMSIRLAKREFGFDEVFLSVQRAPEDNCRIAIMEEMSREGSYNSTDLYRDTLHLSMSLVSTSDGDVFRTRFAHVQFPLSQDLSENLDEMLPEPDPLNITPDSAIPETRKIVKFIVNFLLYLSWPDTGEEFIERTDPRWSALKGKLGHLSGYKKERAKEQLKALDADRRIYVGAKVSFMESESVSGSGPSLMVRTLVSGHWKMQPYGPKQSQRKLIRIEPFWRGPIDAPVTNAMRKVS